MKRTLKVIGSMTLILTLLFPPITAADDNVEKVYRYRSHVMEASSHHLKALQNYVAGNLALKDHVTAHVDALMALSGMYLDLFPAGPQHPESTAKPLVWSDQRGFKQAHQYNRKRIMILKQVDPTDMKTLKRAVNDVRMSCGDCHYYFKEK